MAKGLDLHKLDLYAILGVEETSGEKAIIKGYRKKALKCHPDKNPDNPRAAEEFHQLSQALEILTDAAARAAYDRSRKAKKENEARNQALDSKRKKFKEDLEARERAAEEKLKSQKTVAAEKNLQKEVDRLRKEGSRLVEQEKARLREELKELSRSNNIKTTVEPNITKPQVDDEEVVRIKLKWKASKDDTTNGGYDKRLLMNILSCYGQVNSLIISAKRNGSAIVEFESSGVSPSILEEKGLPKTPFTMMFLSGKPSEVLTTIGDDDRNGNLSPHLHKPRLSTSSSLFSDTENHRLGVDSFSHVGSETNGDVGNATGVSFGISGNFSIGVGGSEEKNFESLVLMRMRQAEERKRLIAQMQEEDENG